MRILNLASGAEKQVFGARRFGSACSAAAAATVVGVALATPAAAQTVTYTDAALGYGYFTVNISSPTTIGGAAGLLVLTTASGDIDTWCVDLYDYLNTSGTFVIGSLTNDSAPVSAGGPNPLSNAQIGQIGALVENGDALVNAPPSGYTANDVGAAIQLAIWQVEYPTFSYSWSPSEANADALAAIFYADATAGAGDWAAYYDIVTLTEPDNQTQIVDPSTQNLDPPGLPQFTRQGLPFPVPQVPEPSTWALMMVGALGLAGASLRRQPKLGDRARPKS
ncbi:PEP-CTERM sorting domain-containing protein [Roseiarcus sp.]|uniref:PEP-CTERM sorting domain-containing protein n=1 Tax=Roseiarcus sp. TaxID=1969460 RepID=UPI003C55E471